MRKITAAALILAILVSSAVFSACDKINPTTPGDGVETTESTVSEQESVVEESKEEISDISAEPSKPEITKEQLNEVKGMLSKYNDIPEFSSDSETISAREISSKKKIRLIIDNSNNSFSDLVSRQFKSAAASAGFKKSVADKSDGTPAFYNEQLEKASDSSDVVVMYGDINKDVVGTTIEKTQAHGVRVLSAGNVGKGESDHYVDHTIPINYQLAGQLMADWTISKNKAKVNALAINNSDSTLSTSVYKGFAEEFQKYVTSGYCTVLSGSSIEAGNGLSTKIKEAIDKDPNLNYIVVLDESMIADAISGVEQSSNRDLKIVATGGSKEAFGEAETGRIEMLVAQSYEWIAYAMVDYSLRVLNSSELPKEQDVPVRVVTAKSIKQSLKENTYDDIDGFYEICFGANFVTGYSNLWDL